MPKNDKTFTPGDIIRFWCNNLTKDEQNEVILFFWLVLPGIVLDNNTIKNIFDLIADGFGSTVQKVLVKLFAAYIRILRTVINNLWANIIIRNERTRKEVINCINSRLQDISKPE